MPAHPKTSVDELIETIGIVVENKMENEDYEKDRILITPQSMVNHYVDKQEMTISAPTLRNYGFCEGGALEMKHPEVFSYNTTGKKSRRGIIVDMEEFEDQIGFNHGED